MEESGGTVSQRPDEELVKLVAERDDRSAFAELVERHQRGVFSLLHRILGPDDEIEDIAQNVFIAAYRGLRTFRGNARFGTWLYRVTYNQACSALRRRSTKKEKMLVQHPEDETGSPIEFADQGSADPSELLLAKQVWRAVGRLPTQSRAVVELFYGRGMSYPEIAEALDLPVGTVKTHLHRARNHLRELLVEQPAVSGGKTA